MIAQLLKFRDVFGPRLRTELGQASDAKQLDEADPANPEPPFGVILVLGWLVAQARRRWAPIATDAGAFWRLLVCHWRFSSARLATTAAWRSQQDHPRRNAMKSRSQDGSDLSTLTTAIPSIVPLAMAACGRDDPATGLAPSHSPSALTVRKKAMPSICCARSPRRPRGKQAPHAGS